MELTVDYSYTDENGFDIYTINNSEQKLINIVKTRSEKPQWRLLQQTELDENNLIKYYGAPIANAEDYKIIVRKWPYNIAYKYLRLNKLTVDYRYYLQRKEAIRYLIKQSPAAHIKEIDRLWHDLPEKPSWLTAKQLEYFKTSTLNIQVIKIEADTSNAQNITLLAE